jgi:hypothetical protein
LQALDYTLIELVPDTCSDSYSLRAQVQQGRTRAGETGIYFLGSSNETVDGVKAQYVFTINFATAGNFAGIIYLNGRRIRGELMSENIRVAQAPIDVTDKEWHDLEVHVSPEKIDVLLDGLPLWNKTPDTLAMHVSLLPPGQKPGSPPPTINLRAPIGLYGYETEASFHNVVIQPR